MIGSKDDEWPTMFVMMRANSPVSLFLLSTPTQVLMDAIG